MRTPVFIALEGPEFGGARTNDAYPRVLSEVLTTTRPMVRLTLGNRESLMFAVPATSDLRSVLAARRVIKLTPPGEPVSEWLVSRVVEAVAPGGAPALAVECDPIWAIMGDVGIIEEVLVGGQSYSNLGGLNGRAANYLATYVIPALQRRGVNWVELGTIDPTVQFDYSWDAQTPLQVVNAVAGLAAAEWEFERDDAYQRYLLNMVDRVGSSAPTVRVREGLDVLQVDTQRTRERLFTAIRVQGDLETGGEERSNIGLASWRVTDVTGDVITLEAHGGGLGPVLEDGQHVGLYVEAEDGSFWEIVDSTAPDELELESGAGTDFSVGDDVMIVADDQGTLLTELRSPSGIANYGYVQGLIQRPGFGHRNWLKNPFVADWDGSQIEVDRARVTPLDGDTYTVTSAPTGFAWDTDDRLWVNGRLHNVLNSGSGTGTIDVSGTTLSGPTDAVLFKNSISRKPTGYTISVAGALLRTVGTGEEVVACLARGAQNFSTAQPLKQTINVDGVPANKVFPAGTIITYIQPILLTRAALAVTGEEVTANGSGEVDLPVCFVSSSTSITDNLAIDLYLPPLQDGEVGCGSMPTTSTGGFNTRLDVSCPFRLVPGLDRVVVSASFVGASARAWTSPDGPFIGLVVNGNLEGTTYVTDTRTGTGFRYRSGRADFALEGISDPNVSVRIWYPSVQNTLLECTWLTGVSVALTSESAPTIVEGSQATRLFQFGQLALSASRQWPATYTATVQELSSAWGLPVDSPAFALGAYIHLVAPSAGIDQILRVTEIQYDPFDPDVKTLVLDTDPDRITQITAKQRARAVFVNVDVEVDQDGRARETVLVSESPPVAVPGVNRFVVDQGVTPTTDLLNIQILE
jgi:hypothetical protein